MTPEANNVAACIREQLRRWNQAGGAECARMLVFNVARAVALEYELDDPAFDRASFLKACGFDG